jgi:hypothetical protein
MCLECALIVPQMFPEFGQINGYGRLQGTLDVGAYTAADLHKVGFIRKLLVAFVNYSFHL